MIFNEDYPLKNVTKNILSISLLLLIVFKSLGQPSITSFAPTAAPVGAQVTITGSNFSPNALENIVFFGTVKANIISASVSSLTVTVPYGSTYKPISVTTNGLTAYSRLPFTVTFTGAAAQFTSSSFSYAARVDSVDSNIETTKYSVGDLDNDGKLDIVTVDRLNNTMSVYRNTTIGKDISFSSRIDFSTGTSPRACAIADINGDGLLDIIVSNLKDNTVSVYKNTTIGGNISFASKVDFLTAVQPSTICVADLDKDGKSDLVVNTINTEGYISVLKNNSNSGSISFLPKIDLQVYGGSIEEIRTADVDGDGKEDIIVPNYASGQIAIFRNTSYPGNISFAGKININSYSLPFQVEISDFNGDDKPDIVLMQYYSSYVWVYHNNSTAGNISFSEETILYSSNVANGICINDFDGDTKPDLLVKRGSEEMMLYKNKSVTGGVISFNSGTSFQCIWDSPIISGDFDQDGLTDLALKSGVERVTIWKNQVTMPQIISFSPGSAPAGGTVTINGFNFSDVKSVKFGEVSASSFTIENSSKINAVVGAGATGDVKINTSNDSASFPGFEFIGPPAIISFTPDSATTNEKIIVKGQNFKAISSVKFGGIPAAFDLIDPSTIYAYVGVGATGDLSVTNAAGTASKPGFKYIPKPKIYSFSPTKALSGSSITIKGINLSDVSSVSFGNTPAVSFTIVDSVTIIAKVGTGSSGNVSVTNALGTASLPGFVCIPPPIITSFTPVVAATGDTVIISGYNFISDYSLNSINYVKFGGVVAYFSIIDSFTVRAIVREGASGEVSVESYRGNSSMPGFTFIPPPVINSVYPKIIGPGSEVTIAGSNLSNVNSILFGGTPAKSFTVISPDTILAKVSEGSTGWLSLATNKYKINAAYLEYTAFPIIYNLSPSAGEVGKAITITGAGFDSIATNNVVFFGGVKAKVISANSNKIIAEVPAGASYAPVSVTSLRNNLTALSNAKFDVTFPVDPNAFNDSSFAGALDLATGTEPYDAKLADLDNDGKLDIVIINHGSTFISVYRNISSPGRLTFSPRIDIEIGFTPKAIAVADMDGDGKQDLLISNDGANPVVGIYHNQSSLGTFSFSNPYVIYGFYYNIGFIETVDYNIDGRPDIVFACTNCAVANGGVFLAENTSVNGNLSFYYYGSFSFGVSNSSGSATIGGSAITDYNYDFKPDILTGAYRLSAIFIFKNQGAVGGAFPGFSPFFIGDEYSASDYYSHIPQTANFTSPFYPDMVAGNYIYKNNKGSFIRDISLSARVSAIGDLDGDGKPDIIGKKLYTDALSLFKNNCDNGTISFAPAYEFNMPAGIKTVTGDLDGDSKPEICLVYNWGNVVRILRNRMNEAAPPPPLINNFSPQSGSYGSQIIITGSNIGQATSVTFGGVPALYFTIISQDSIIATVGNGASGKISVTTPGGSISIEGFVYNTITPVNELNRITDGKLIIYPNPAKNIVIIKHSASLKASVIKVIDFNGRIILQKDVQRNSTETQLSVDNIPAGSYHVLWVTDRGSLANNLLILH